MRGDKGFQRAKQNTAKWNKSQELAKKVRNGGSSAKGAAEELLKLHGGDQGEANKAYREATGDNDFGSKLKRFITGER